MQCPHCSIAFHGNWRRNRIKYDSGIDSDWYCLTIVCPECDNPNIKIRKEAPDSGDVILDAAKNIFAKEQWVYPKSRRGKQFSDEVPNHLKSDYFEACEVLLTSPRASATLSRRILEALLYEQDYRQNRLIDQIKAVRNEEDPDKKLPTLLLRITDAVRQFGNFSAHQKTNAVTLQIIEVEPGEAELCLEIVEGLFEHYYVRPAIDARKLEAVNEKLQQLGRDPL